MKELIFIVFFIATYMHACTTGTETVETTGHPISPSTVQIEILPDTTLRLNGEAVDPANLGDELQQINQNNPIDGVVLIADRSANTGTLVMVMDIVKTSGHDNITVQQSGR